MKQNATITIAICTFNRAEYLRDTLNDLSNQTADPNRFEILMIDNNSTDHTTDVCNLFKESHPDFRFRYFHEPNQGLSHARNRAFDEASEEHVLFIDDDVHLEENFVAEGLNYIEANPDLRCAGGRIFVSFDDGDPGWIPHELMPMFGLHDLGDQKKRYPKDNFPRGGNMLIHKKVVKSTGYFDPELGRIGKELIGSEEKAYFDRARKSGFTLHYLPELNLHHRIGNERLTKEYLKNQSIGIGKSEYFRLRSSRLSLIGKFLSEIVKSVGSILLGAMYIVVGKWKAAGFLLRFRYWVLTGFLTANRNIK